MPKPKDKTQSCHWLPMRLAIQGTPEGVEDNGSLTRVAAFPIGIDPERFQRALERVDVRSHIAELLNRYAGRKVRPAAAAAAAAAAVTVAVAACCLLTFLLCHLLILASSILHAKDMFHFWSCSCLPFLSPLVRMLVVWCKGTDTGSLLACQQQFLPGVSVKVLACI